MTPTPAEQKSLYLWLKGDPLALRCVKTCQTCGGTGDYTLRDSNLVSSCPTCSGHGAVFRTDAEGREIILQAVREWSCRYIIFGVPRELWDGRARLPWCESIEHHVRDYLAPAPDLTANDGAELKRLLESWTIRRAGDVYSASVWDGDGIEHGVGFNFTTEAAALIAATLAALELKGEQ